jgi:hypothetical protein
VNSCNFKDLTGYVFGKTKVLSFFGHDNYKRATWLCLCLCGNKHVSTGFNLRNGNTSSCGCIKNETNKKHGLTGCLTYVSWQCMIQRCTNPKNKSWYRYGGAGVTVCNEWKGDTGFETFLKDMGERPTKGFSIDRINNSLGYFKDNCRWATYSQQNRNSSRNDNITFQGVTKCRSDWAKHFGINYETLRMRLKMGWSDERALTTPVIKRY